MEEMQVPKFYSFVKIMSVICASIGCIFGGVSIIGSLTLFKWGFWQGVAAISTGGIIIASSLMTLGLIFCFLSSVKAQIEIRNLIHQRLGE